MVFKKIGGCRRSVKEQRYIFAALEIWHLLPAESRMRAKDVMRQIAETDQEGQALRDVLMRGLSPERAREHTGVTRPRIYEMRREFYDRFWP